jgi:hypothetical protein
MRAFRFLNLSILSALVGCSALVYAQDDKPQDNKPTQQEEPKPQPKRDEMKPQDEAKPQQDEAKPSKQDKREQEQEQKVRSEQQTENSRPAGKGGRIPDDKFRAHFGHSHTFTAKTVIVQGRPQFQYGGYSFQLVDAWPVDWAYTDDCYIDYIDGEYFLFDLLHPGVRIAVFVVM